MTETHESDAPEESLRFEYELDAPPAQVWRALTIPEYVAQWLIAPPASPQTDARPVLLDSEPNRSVRYAWREKDDPSHDSVVTFRLTPNDAGGTTFSIVHELTVKPDALRTRNAANSNRPSLLLAA